MRKVSVLVLGPEDMCNPAVGRMSLITSVSLNDFEIPQDEFRKADLVVFLLPTAVGSTSSILKNPGGRTGVFCTLADALEGPR